MELTETSESIYETLSFSALILQEFAQWVHLQEVSAMNDCAAIFR